MASRFHRRRHSIVPYQVHNIFTRSSMEISVINTSVRTCLYECIFCTRVCIYFRVCVCTRGDRLSAAMLPGSGWLPTTCAGSRWSLSDSMKESLSSPPPAGPVVVVGGTCSRSVRIYIYVYIKEEKNDREVEVQGKLRSRNNGQSNRCDNPHKDGIPSPPTDHRQAISRTGPCAGW